MPLLGNRAGPLHLERQHARRTTRRCTASAPTRPTTGPAAARGNHNGGVLRFGPDGKIYLIVGDNGRRGQLQNLFDGPFGEGIPDDQFGGPDPDNDHLTGVILRLNPDGTAPRDNPFYKVGAERGGQVGANLKKIYAYGIRNSFGMAFDPFSGDLWEQENGDDSFSEINRVEPGFNSGWVQVMGPLERVAQFKAIETTRVPNPPDPNAAGGYYGLQQIRWDPINIADTPWEAYQRLFKLPGSEFSDPGDGLEVRGRPGRHRLPLHQGAGQGVQGRPVRRLRPRLAARRQPLPPEDLREPQEGRGRRQAPEGPRRRQPRQVRDHRERVAALRRELRRHAGSAARARTARSTSCPTPRARSTRSAGSSPAIGSSPAPPKVRGMSTRERIEELADQITALRDAYYRGEPLVADAEYDALEDELRALIAAHPGARAAIPTRSSRSARRRCCTRRSATAGRCSRWRRRPRPSRSRRSSTASPASRWW